MIEKIEKPKRFYLSDYKTPDFIVESLKLSFDLNEELTRVVSKAKYKRTQDMDTQNGKGLVSDLALNGVGLSLKEIRLNGELLEPNHYKVTEKELVLFSPPSLFELEIHTELNPRLNSSLEGLYLSNGILCTQCEAQGFRKITYFLDRPDVMTSFEVYLEADKNKFPILLSNGDLIEQRTNLPSNRHSALWRDPHKKPCYLFALVAGDLGVIQSEFKTNSKKVVNLSVYASHGKQELCEHAMNSLKRAMKWDEDTFGLEYDLSNYMIVAIDDFNAGAMENKGLNIFNSRLVLASAASATDEDYKAIESVVGHEYFHNWTGNRITLRDWFELSLKEGLTVFRDQQFSGDMSDRSVQRIEDVISLLTRQFPEDAGPNAHPVRPESCLAVDNFFTPTIYEKGAEVIRMMLNFVGRAGFRKGMDLYVKRFDGCAVTIEDLATAISDANDIDFTQFKKWFSQSGTPRVLIQESYDSIKQTYTVELSQETPPTINQQDKQPLHMPILFGLLKTDGTEVNLQRESNLDSGIKFNSEGESYFDLKEAHLKVEFQKMMSKPILSVLRQFSSPVLLNLQTPAADRLFIAQSDSDGFNRWQASQEIMTKSFHEMIVAIGVPKIKDALRAKETGSISSAPTPKELIELIGAQLRNKKLDPILKAKLITFPSDVVLMPLAKVRQTTETKTKVNTAHGTHESEKAAPSLHDLEFDPIKYLDVYQKIHEVCAKTFSKEFHDIFEECEHNLKKSDSKSPGFRALRNQVLGFLCQIEPIDFIYQQYRQAKNMTDTWGSLRILANYEHPLRVQALEDFYEKWKQDSLVLNKWFQIQAGSYHSRSLDHVKGLTAHKAYNPKNPNHVYSLLRTFGRNLWMFNRNFGTNDSPEYAFEFFADQIILIDKANPQVAARLCDAFNVAPRLSPLIAELARTEIQRILKAPGLSPNSRELLERI